MEFIKWSVIPLLALIGMITPSKNVKKSESIAATSARGYIEIDGSDPFNIPKHSKYVKGPTPDFDSAKDDKDASEESSMSPTREHKDNNRPAKELENVDSDESPDLVVDAQKDIEREKALDKVYESPKEENSQKEDDESPNDENAPKEETDDQSQDDQNAALASQQPRPDIPMNTKQIQDIEQMFHSTKQTNIMSPTNDPLK